MEIFNYFASLISRMDKDNENFNPLNIPRIETIVLDEIPDDKIYLGQRDKDTGKIIVNLKYTLVNWNEDNKRTLKHRGP